MSTMNEKVADLRKELDELAAKSHELRGHAKARVERMRSAASRKLDELEQDAKDFGSRASSAGAAVSDGTKRAYEEIRASISSAWDELGQSS